MGSSNSGSDDDDENGGSQAGGARRIVSEERNDLSTKWDVKIERCSRGSGLFRRNKCKKVL